MALAMLRAVPPEIVSTGVVYYVVGATVGLFNQLRTDTSPEIGKEDFGFRRRPLLHPGAVWTRSCLWRLGRCLAI